MAAPTLIGHVDAYGTGTAARVLTPHASTVVGDLLIVVFAANAQTITPPAGWTSLKAAVDTGTLRTAVFAKFRETGDTTYSFTIGASATDTHTILTYRGVDTNIADLIVGGNGVRAANGTSTTSVAPALTTLAADTVVVTIGTERTTTTESNVTSISSGTADFFVVQNGSTGLETISVSHVDASTPATTAAVTITYPQVQASNGFAFQLGIPPVPTTAFTGTAGFSGTGLLTASGVPAVAGSVAFSGAGVFTPSGVAGGSILVPFSCTGTLSATGRPGISGAASLTAGGVLAASGKPGFSGSAALAGAGVLAARTSSPVDLFMARSTMYAAHRGGSADWPEETLYAYAQAAAWNADMALEISLWYTSDGVAVASHDQTTGRVFSGTSLDIPSNTWATLSTKTTIVGNQPIARVTDILDLYATGNRVIFVDNKGNQQQTAFYAMLAAYGGNERFIIKAYGGSTSWAPTASSRGYKSWGYFFASDTAGLPGWAPLWTMLGQDYAAGSSDWAAVKSYGKPVLAHIIGTAANKATAAAFGPQGFMASGVTEVVPQTPAVVALAGTGTLAVSGVQGFAGTASFVGGGSLTASSANAPAGTAAMSGAGLLGVLGTPRASGGVALSGSGSLQVTGKPGVAGAVSLTAAGTISVSGSPSVTAVAQLTGLGQLTVSGSVVSRDVTVSAEFGPRNKSAALQPRRYGAHFGNLPS